MTTLTTPHRQHHNGGRRRGLGRGRNGAREDAAVDAHAKRSTRVHWFGCAAAEASPPPYYSHRWPGHPSTHPLPLLFCGNDSLTPSRTSEPSYSSPRGHPLSRLPRLCIVPFLGLTVVHRRGAVGAAWSMWSTTEFHRKNTVRGEADSWVHGSRKEVPPYYAENNYSST